MNVSLFIWTCEVSVVPPHYQWPASGEKTAVILAIQMIHSTHIV